MIVKNHQGGKLVILSRAFDNRAKILNACYFFAFSFAGLTYFKWWILSENRHLDLVTFIGIVVYLFAGYRFIDKAIQAEKIFVDKSFLTISRQGFLSRKSNSYDIKLISDFRHLEKPRIADHALAGKSFDYLGFQTQQQLINEMHGDNRLAFDYSGTTVTFGENIYSWEFEELEVLLFNITKNDFRYTEEAEDRFNPGIEND